MIKLNRKERIVISGLSVVMLLPSLFVGYSSAIGWITGYLLGAVGVVIHILIVFKIKYIGQDQFLKFYYGGLLLRFLLLISLMILILILTKIEQISFTVSFIISYILHSVLEIILLNKELAKK